ncbi:MAG: hypothetical protein V1723_00545 [Candidatus Uhrbacteria bacterium]
MASTAPTAPITKGTTTLTANFLRGAWLQLLPTFGLTLLYINFHFIARYMAGSQKFVDFGSEWKTTKVPGEGQSNIGLRYGEIIALALLDAIAVAAILGVIALGSLIVWAISDPCGFMRSVGLGVATMFGTGGIGVWAGCKALGVL